MIAPTQVRLRKNAKAAMRQTTARIRNWVVLSASSFRERSSRDWITLAWYSTPNMGSALLAAVK